MLGIVLAMTLTLGGCETISALLGKAPPPAQIAPSTFCEIYEPVEAPYEKTSPQFHEWWDRLEAHIGQEMSARIRGSNAAYVEICITEKTAA